jgi:hypothetical protein
MGDLYLCTHYGFGDYVMCYGLIKELSLKYNKIFLFGLPHCTPLHINNIKRLYSSIKNVEIITKDPSLYKDVMYLGWGKYFEMIEGGAAIQCAKYFYKQAGVPLNLMWSNFYFKRDLDKERDIFYNRLKLRDDDEYIFLHEDISRDYIIDRKYIKPGVRVIILNQMPDISILDILYLIERAAEVHIINTGLVSFVDQMNIKHDNLNYHKYTRPESFEQPILRLKWKILN